MSGPKYRDWILETIDQLRKRKARPDLERICHMVERRYGLTFLETEHDLEKLVEEEAIIKVDYKGSTSYRNAAKWRRNHFGVPVCSPSHSLLSDKICNAVRQLNKSEFTNGEKGANITDIENSLVSISQESQILKNHLQIYLQREIHCGRLKKLPNGNFVIAQPRFKQAKMKTAHAKSTTQSTANPIPSKRGRPPTKRKRFKKSHGPDFESYSVTKPKTDEKCDYCLMSAKSNVNGQFEELLVCKDCNAKAHPSCMDYSEELAKRANSSPWQCIDCKTCYVCEDSGEADAMLFCDACDKGYHMSCHEPALFDKPTGQWVCSQCQLEDSYEEMASFNEGQSADGAGASCLPTPSASPEHNQDGTDKSSPPEKKKAKHNFPVKPKKVEKKYPDASDWSIDDVIKFFNDTGFSEQSHVFKEQEIDGKSLLLMKRSDVLTGLSLKLGPALKIYTHVQKLQTSGP